MKPPVNQIHHIPWALPWSGLKGSRSLEWGAQLSKNVFVPAGYGDLCILFPVDDFVPYDNVVTNLFNRTNIS